MDILTRQGELSEEDISELKAMSPAEVVAFVSDMSKSWYQLLESLEDVHRQDLDRLRTTLTEKFQAALSTMKDSHTAQLQGLKDQLTSLEKGLESGIRSAKEDSETLARLKSMCDKLMRNSTAGR